MIIHSDHQNLTYFKSAQKLNRHQARWALYLSEFNIKLIHQPASKMYQSDALSRRPDLIPDEDHDNKNVTQLPDNLFLNLLDLALQGQILENGKTDDFLTTFSINDPPFGTATDWMMETIDNALTIFYKDRNYIPNNLDLRCNIVR